ncbi:MAG: hypothetical protein RL385_4245, partial [Pseudomonadota bacterium]
ALTEALDDLRRVSPTEPARLLAPYFTGAASSLWAVLKDRGEHSYRIVTGSATGALGLPEELGARVTLERTVVEDDCTLEFLAAQLSQADPVLESGDMGNAPVAVLAESGTGYGAGFADLEGARAHAGSAPPPKTTRSSCDVSSLHWDVYRFPLHIAGVHAAHELADHGQKREFALNHTLSLSFSEHAQHRHTGTGPRSELTPFTAELALRNSLNEIARRGYRYLLIAATDVADTIFLAQEARLYSPSARLITIGAHALTSHPDLQASLSGMLVASSYPLIQENQAWQTGGASAGQFESFVNESQQGMFNALLRLLSEPRAANAGLVDYRPYWLHDESGAPSVWLLEVYGGRFWPIRVSLPSGTQESSGEQSTSAVLRVGVLGRAIPYLLTLINFTFLVAHLLTVKREDVRMPLLRALSKPRAAFLAVWRAYLGALSLTLALLGTHVIGPRLCSLYDVDAYGAERTLAWIGITASVLLLVPGTFHIGYALVERMRGLSLPGEISTGARLRCFARDFGCRAAVAFSASGAGVALVCARSAFFLYVALVRREDAWLALRLSDPLGLCPIAPLLLVASGLIVWAVLGLGRVRLLAAFPTDGPFPKTIRLPVGAHLNDVYMQRASPWAKQTAAVELGVGAIAVIPSVMYWVSIHPTLEWQGFDALAKICFLTLASAVVVCALQFSTLWASIDTLTRRLVATPMVDAYSRIGNKFSGSFGVYLLSAVPKPQELGVSLRSAETLVALADGMRGDPNPIAQCIHEGTRRLRVVGATLHARLAGHLHQQDDGQANNVSSTLRPSEARTAHAAFFQASAEIWTLLEDVWEVRAKHPSETHLSEDEVRALRVFPELTAVLAPWLKSFWSVFK